MPPAEECPFSTRHDTSDMQGECESQADRSIETAFQTAVALAEHEGKRDKEGTILVTDRHLKSVLALSKDFKNYLTELHEGHDEAMRAQRRKERLDDSGDASEPSRRV